MHAVQAATVDGVDQVLATVMENVRNAIRVFNSDLDSAVRQLHTLYEASGYVQGAFEVDGTSVCFVGTIQGVKHRIRYGV